MGWRTIDKYRMRIQDLRSPVYPAGGLYFHGSPFILPIGFILKPQTKGYYNQGEWGAGNRFMNKFRPEGVLPREESVYMFKNWSDRGLAPATENIYQVRALGPVWRSALNNVVVGYIGSKNYYDNWAYDTKFQAEYHGLPIPDTSKKAFYEEHAELAKRYWAGLPDEDPQKETSWEWRTPAAEVIAVKRESPKSWSLGMNGKKIKNLSQNTG